MKTPAVSPNEIPEGPHAQQEKARFNPTRMLARIPLRFRPYLLLGAFTLCLLWPLCIGRGLYWGDILLYFEPMQRFAQVSLRQGQLPLWNPYIFGGQPYVGNPQMGVFYPLNLFSPLFPPWLFLNFSMLLHLFLCGAFMFRFLAYRTSSEKGALAGALVYMGSSALVSRLQFPPMIQTAAYCPLLLLCIDVWIDNQKFSTWILTALTVGCMTLAGHPQMAYLSFLCALIYGILRLLRHLQLQDMEANVSDWRYRSLRFVKRLPRALLIGSRLLGAALLGLTLTLAQTLPALQLLMESPREQMTVELANRFFLTLPDLATLLFPNFFGHPATADYWTSGNAWETSLFIGWLPLGFILLALLRLRRRRLVWFWTAAVILCIWLAMGNAGGLYWLAFFTVPGLAKFHDPARFLFLATVAFSVLTSLGFDACKADLLRDDPRRIRLAIIGIALPLLWYGWRWNPTSDLYRHEPEGLRADHLQVRPLSSAIPAGTRIFNSSHENYWRRYITHGYADYGEANASTIETFLNTELPNLPMRSGIEAMSGYEPVQIMGASRLDNLNRVAQLRKDPQFSRLIGMWNVKTVVLPHEQILRDPRFVRNEANAPPGKQPAVTLWQNRDVLPRAWLVRQTHHVESQLRILAALTAPDFDPRSVALISDQPAEEKFSGLEWGTGRQSALPVLPVQILEKRMDLIRIRADAGAAPAFLIYSGTAYPGWYGSVDARPVPLHRADGGLMGMMLPPGKHEVQLTYQPAGLRVGLYFSLFTLSVLVGGGIIVRMRNRRDRMEKRNRADGH